MSYSFGKPLTEEEFRKLKASNPSVRTIPVSLDSTTGSDLQAKLREKIREKAQDRQRVVTKT